MRGEISSGRAAKRHPLDWYVEAGWEWGQIADAIGLDDEREAGTIWDPAAGYGHSGSWLQGAGFAGRVFLSDLVDNVAWEDFAQRERVTFTSADFLELETAPDFCSIWCNPPYSYKDVIYDGARMKIAEAFVRHAIKMASHRVVMLLPLKWLAMGKRRSRLVRIDHPPQSALIFTERPSMPPGDRIHLMGNRAFSGGMVDYCALVWDVRHPTAPGETRIDWLPPLGEV